MKQILTVLIAAVAIAACGPLAQDSTAAQISKTVLGGVTGTAQPPQPRGSVASQEDLLNNPGKYIRVSIRNIERFDTGVPSGENRQRVTWVDSDNISYTFDGGLLVATRGLAGDLIAADVTQTRKAIKSGGGIATRTHEYLTDLDGISTEVLQCRIVSEGPDVVERLGTTQKSTKFREDCSGENFKFANIYWVNRNGSILRSLQLASAKSGFLQIDVF